MPCRQAIIWTNTRILLIGPLNTNLSEILVEIHTFSFTNIHLKILGNGGNFVSASVCYQWLQLYQIWCCAQEITPYTFENTRKWRQFCLGFSVLSVTPTLSNLVLRTRNNTIWHHGSWSLIRVRLLISCFLRSNTTSVFKKGFASERRNIF